MAKKPNYRFERTERERQKAAKKAARLADKQAKSEAGADAAADTGEQPDAPQPADDSQA